MPSNRPKIAVIILNWNNAPDTLECLDSIYKSDYPHFTVYVADNGSTDGSLTEIRAAYPQAIYIENKANLGFAEGNNRAILAALKDGADFLFLLNNDAIVQSDTLALLEAAAKAHPNAAFLGPKIYYYDQPSTISFGRTEWSQYDASFISHDLNKDESEAEKRGVSPTGFVSGCALFARSPAIEKVGLMEPKFFLNWEEVDWCSRMLKSGYSCLYVPYAKAWHKVSRSFAGGNKGPLWLYYYWRNRLFWMERNFTRKEYFSMLRTVVLGQIKTKAREALFGPDKQKARASLRGVLDYCLRRFGPARRLRM